MFLLAARDPCRSVTGSGCATGALYPPVSMLRAVSRSIAIAVAREASVGARRDRPATDDELEAVVDAAMWWPDYVPYATGPCGGASPR